MVIGVISNLFHCTTKLIRKTKASKKGFYEIWQSRNNQITEGSTSNAFTIVNSEECDYDTSC